MTGAVSFTGPVWWLSVPAGLVALGVAARGFWLLLQGRNPGFTAGRGRSGRPLGPTGQWIGAGLFAVIGTIFLLFGMDLALGSTSTRRVQVAVASTDYSSHGKYEPTYYVISTGGERYEVGRSVYRTVHPGVLLACKVTAYPVLLPDRLNDCTLPSSPAGPSSAVNR